MANFVFLLFTVWIACMTVMIDARFFGDYDSISSYGSHGSDYQQSISYYGNENQYYQQSNYEDDRPRQNVGMATGLGRWGRRLFGLGRKARRRGGGASSSDLKGPRGRDSIDAGEKELAEKFDDPNVISFHDEIKKTDKYDAYLKRKQAYEQKKAAENPKENPYSAQDRLSDAESQMRQMADNDEYYDEKEDKKDGGDKVDNKDGDKGGDKGDKKGDKKGDEKGDDKGDDKGDSKANNKGDNKVDDNVDDKGDGKPDNKIDDKGDDKGDDKVDKKIADKVDDKLDDKADTKIDEQVDKPENNNESGRREVKKRVNSVDNEKRGDKDIKGGKKEEDKEDKEDKEGTKVDEKVADEEDNKEEDNRQESRGGFGDMSIGPGDFGRDVSRTKPFPHGSRWG